MVERFVSPWLCLALVTACTSTQEGSQVNEDSDSSLMTTPQTGGAHSNTTTAATATGTTPLPTNDDDEGGLSTGDLSLSFDLGAIPDAPVPTDCTQDVDVVFVMDVSTTMGSFINTLASEIELVDQALQTYGLPSDPHYGLVVFVDDAALLNGGAPYANATVLQDDFTYWSGFTSSNQQVGGGNSNSTFEENSLDALHLAATQFQWRPSATTVRIVIHTTDDTFWDGPTTGNGVPILNSYGGTVNALQAEQVRVFAFADDIGGSCNCEDVTVGWSSPYMGAVSIPDATDGAVFDIQQILGGTASLSDAITSSVEESICDPYDPVG